MYVFEIVDLLLKSDPSEDWTSCQIDGDSRCDLARLIVAIDLP